MKMRPILVGRMGRKINATITERWNNERHPEKVIMSGSSGTVLNLCFISGGVNEP